eukprot:scaffold17122_cov113-Isochrysis_galbana.AAC.3
MLSHRRSGGLNLTLINPRNTSTPEPAERAPSSALGPSAPATRFLRFSAASSFLRAVGSTGAAAARGAISFAAHASH